MHCTYMCEREGERVKHMYVKESAVGELLNVLTIYHTNMRNPGRSC